MALVLANAAFQAAEFIGWPEARIPLAEAALYIAPQQKQQYDPGNRCCARGCKVRPNFGRAGTSARCPLSGSQRLGHGAGYKYAHDFPDHFVAQDYLGADKRYYEPTDQASRKRSKSASRNGEA